MKNEDRIRFLHMRDATAEAVAMAAGRSRDQLLADRMFCLALTRCLEIIGEAASRLTGETRAEHPSLPYVEMITMRNRLIHAYFDIDLDILWTTVSLDLPPLLASLELILKSAEPD
ncbi:MAG: DUF86 domain-containing protein [Bryobacterales bacterium]|nr:DUF86 domain-containing protein [Bryobacterales bacterium]